MDFFAASPLALAIVLGVASYLVCGIPFGKIFGKLLGNVDLQQSGSGNIGTTNALRVAGPKVAVLTLLCDCLKGVFCMNLARLIISRLCFAGDVSALLSGGGFDYLMAIIALACVFGHVFSPYLHFKGGKGIAVGVGVLFGWYWPLALVHLAIFIVLVALTRIVSVGSIATAGLVCLTVPLILPETSLTCHLIWSFLGFVVVWAHRSNIRKLLAHKESRLSFSKSQDKEGER
ncbi:MAG: glycerol-3-phosphate 1-O-acyltransferase PlsY [Coriobacteriaceae bacterium]|nr:glycerol-3-phosphate 1-O-acyltransferase PlsY [Coriobacteriaceae bacterium]